MESSKINVWWKRDPCGIICALLTYMLIIFAHFNFCINILDSWPHMFQLFHGIIFTVIITLAVWSHLACMSHDPGVVWKIPVSSSLPVITHSLSDCQKQSSSVTHIEPTNVSQTVLSENDKELHALRAPQNTSHLLASQSKIDAVKSRYTSTPLNVESSSSHSSCIQAPLSKNEGIQTIELLEHPIDIGTFSYHTNDLVKRQPITKNHSKFIYPLSVDIACPSFREYPVLQERDTIIDIPPPISHIPLDTENINRLYHSYSNRLSTTRMPPDKLLQYPFRDRNRWCKKCSYQKPPRAHHCSVCQRCVIKMDHHCPWYIHVASIYTLLALCIRVGTCLKESHRTINSINTLNLQLSNEFLQKNITDQMWNHHWNHELNIHHHSPFPQQDCLIRHIFRLLFTLIPKASCQFSFTSCIFLSIAFLESVIFGLFTGIMVCDQLIGIAYDSTGIDKLSRRTRTHWDLQTGLRSVFGYSFHWTWFFPFKANMLPYQNNHIQE